MKRRKYIATTGIIGSSLIASGNLSNSSIAISSWNINSDRLDPTETEIRDLVINFSDIYIRTNNINNIDEPIIFSTYVYVDSDDIGYTEINTHKINLDKSNELINIPSLTVNLFNSNRDIVNAGVVMVKIKATHKDTQSSTETTQVVGVNEGEQLIEGNVKLDAPIDGAKVRAIENGRIVDSDITRQGSYSITVSDPRTARISVSYNNVDDGTGSTTAGSGQKKVNSKNTVDFNFSSNTVSESVNIENIDKIIYFTDQDGTRRIGNAYQLQSIFVNKSADYRLIKNIDATVTDGWSGGSGFNPSTFSGTLDGNGYYVKDITINRPSVKYLGIITELKSGTIKNIGFRDVNIIGGSITGVVGGNQGEIAKVYSTGSIEGDNSVGGIAGNNDGTIKKSYAHSNIANADSSLGGLVGVNNFSGVIRNCYAMGDVSGFGDSVGGLVGFNRNEVSKSYATGTPSGDYDVGGVIGYDKGSVSGLYWDIVSSGEWDGQAGTGFSTDSNNDGRADEMVAESSVTNMSKLDFDTVWKTTDGYPELRGIHNI